MMILKPKALSLFLIFLFVGLAAHAQNLNSGSYYKISANTPNPNQEYSGIISIDGLLFSAVLSLQSATIDLLNWISYPEEIFPQAEPYKRRLHFGGWINDPTDDNCYNTRGLVLQRDSEVGVETSTNNHCRVVKGLWLDLYTDVKVQEATEIQIDHLVPLKNAYDSGAFNWTRRMRCLYANYMGNKFHLLSVGKHENMSKGDNAPGEYLPPVEAFRCDYIKAWLKVKLIWGLTLSADEAQGVRLAFEQNHCNPALFTMDANELETQTKIITQTDYVCRY